MCRDNFVMVVVDLCAALTSCSPSRMLQQRRRWATGDRDGGADARRDVASLSGPAGTFTSLTPAPFFSVSTVKVEVHSSNSSSGAGSDENLSSSSSDRGSDPGTAAGENDYEDIYEVRQRADGVGLLHHTQHQLRGKESKSPSRDSGSHSRSGSMSSTGSGGGVGGTSGVVGSAVVVLHTTSGDGALHVNSSRASVTNVTVDGSAGCKTVVNGSPDMIECYEPVGVMTPGTCNP